MKYLESEVQVIEKCGNLAKISLAPEHDIEFWVKQSQIVSRLIPKARKLGCREGEDRRGGGRGFCDVKPLGPEWLPLMEFFKTRRAPLLGVQYGPDAHEYIIGLLGPHADRIMVWSNSYWKGSQTAYTVTIPKAARELVPDGIRAVYHGSCHWTISCKDLFVACMEAGLYHGAKIA
jgi:hypothetical protein